MSAIHKLLTDHIDSWTAADTEKKSGRGRSSGNAASVYGIKKLRELILELAVRGKLVPQDPNDEPASELLRRILADKSILLADGGTKKAKLSPTIVDSDKPFALPGSWKWVSLGEVCSYIQRGKGPAYVDKSDYCVVSQKCVRWEGLDLSMARFIEPETVKKYEAYRLLCEGDILWNSTGTGTIGRACLVSKLSKYQFLVADSHVTVVRPISFSSNYLARWIQSPSVQSKIEGLASGSTNQIELNTSTVITHLMPLPPLAEQHRIVAKVDELMSLCDLLETQHNNASDAHEKLVSHLLGTLTESQSAADFSDNWQRIAAHFDTLFTTEASIDALKQTLLQLAVMGKLVAQDPNDEPASELLKRIQVEKAKLVAEGKIKKDKPAKPIANEEKPFEIPKAWEWCRLGEIGIGATGKTPDTREIRYYGGDIPFIGPGQMTPEGKFLPTEKTITEEGLRQSTEALPNDLLMVCIGGSIGKSALCDKRIAFNQQINAIRPVIVNSYFLQAAVSAEFFYNSILNAATGSATPIINRSKWEELLIPIAPEDEQRRIVAGVNKLMKLCDQLDSRLVDANQLQQRIANVIVEQAVA